MLSGSDTAPWSYNPPFLPPENYTQQVARNMSCPETPNQAMMDCLKTRNAADIAGFREIPLVSFNSTLGFE